MCALPRAAGYARILSELDIEAAPNWHQSLVGPSSTTRKTIQDHNQTRDLFPHSYWPGDSLVCHLEFALKYDGINLALLWVIFRAFEPDQIEALCDWIRSKPTGKYGRRAWFLYEFLTGDRLDSIPDLKKGSYVALLDERDYFTLGKGRRSSRHRIDNNLLGDARFCPMVRRTEALQELDALDLKREFEDVVSVYPKNLLDRSIGYLYNAETKSSFQIEAESLSQNKTERFVAVLERAHHQDYLDKSLLIEIQNLIVDQRFQEQDYRSVQNYVGQTIHYGRQRIHYVCPHYRDVQELMDGLMHTHSQMRAFDVQSLVHAAVVAYAFVFLHPFEDGNGRIHRFLIHNVLQLRNAVPSGVIFPVSASMLKYAKKYTESLEDYSRPLMAQMSYELDEDGQMELLTPNTHLYRYMDLTAQTEALLTFVRKTIEEQVVQELEYLASFDQAKEAMENIVELPDRLLNLFIKCCTQNGGKISQGKQKKFFAFLSDEEVGRLEDAVRSSYAKVSP